MAGKQRALYLEWQDKCHLWRHTQLLPRVPLFCSDHILTSSVIYYWTDARQKGIYLLNIRGFPIEHSWVAMTIMVHFVAESSCRLICKILYITGCGLSLLKFLQKSRKYDSVTENNTADNNIGESAGQTHNPGPTGIRLRLLRNVPALLMIRDRILWHVAVIQRLKYSCIAHLQKKRARDKMLRWQQKNWTGRSL